MHSCFEHLGERGGGNPKNIDISFGWAENHKVTQLKDVIEPHSLINSLRSKGVECVKTAVMLYVQWGSTLYHRGHPLGEKKYCPQACSKRPPFRHPNEIIDQMMRQAQKYKTVAGQGMISIF